MSMVRATPLLVDLNFIDPCMDPAGLYKDLLDLPALAHIKRIRITWNIDPTKYTAYPTDLSSRRAMCEERGIEPRQGGMRYFTGASNLPEFDRNVTYIVYLV